MSSIDPIDVQQLSDNDLDQVSGGAGKPAAATAGLKESDAKKVMLGGKAPSSGGKAPPAGSKATASTSAPKKP